MLSRIDNPRSKWHGYPCPLSAYFWAQVAFAAVWVACELAAYFIAGGW